MCLGFHAEKNRVGRSAYFFIFLIFNFLFGGGRERLGLGSE